jgi:uncharacterized protein YggE
MKLVYRGREVELDGVTLEVGEGAYIESATFVDTGEDVSDDVIYELEHDYQEALYDEAYQNAVGAAEARADAMQDR